MTVKSQTLLRRRETKFLKLALNIKYVRNEAAHTWNADIDPGSMATMCEMCGGGRNWSWKCDVIVAGSAGTAVLGFHHLT